MSLQPPSNLNDALYRPGVGIMLFNEHNKIFVARRIDSRADAWQMPQGGIDDNELPLEAALRELKEEIGTNHATIISQYPDWLYYDIPEELAKSLWNGRYRGQRQRWFLMRFNGRDDEINLETEIPEFNDWQWASLDSIVDLIVPFKRTLYIQLLTQFKPYINQGNV
ncbi:MAG: RNA pyrophosphohydrolase [Alphaproteobacteria bacterium]|nr:RNA pyrophosphohydrolase [Alphaproteobacteria bacterium]